MPLCRLLYDLISWRFSNVLYWRCYNVRKASFFSFERRHQLVHQCRHQQLRSLGQFDIMGAADRIHGSFNICLQTDQWTKALRAARKSHCDSLHRVAVKNKLNEVESRVWSWKGINNEMVQTQQTLSIVVRAFLSTLWFVISSQQRICRDTHTIDSNCLLKRAICDTGVYGIISVLIHSAAAQTISVVETPTSKMSESVLHRRSCCLYPNKDKWNSFVSSDRMYVCTLDYIALVPTDRTSKVAR